MGCSGAPEAARRPVAVELAAPAVIASAPLPASPLPAAPAVVPVADGLEIVIDEETLGEHEAGVSMTRIDDGLLVVKNMPATAFLVAQGGTVRPLPDLFRGLRSPMKTWGTLDFSVSDVRGSLDRLAFTISAPATGEEREVSGRSGSWKVSKATPRPPVWLSERTIAPPVTTTKGAHLYEQAPSYQGEAREGFRFVFDGPSKGEKLPVPSPGTNGCKHRLLGHPFLSVLPDGSLIGVGNACASGAEHVATGKLDGVAWPYQTLLPRLARGPLAAERWRDGVGTVDLLPGAEAVDEYAGVDILARAADDVVVLSQVSDGKGHTRAYVAHHDGRAWTDITPPGAPEWLSAHWTRSGVLHLFAPTRAFRRGASGWEPIEVELDAADDACQYEQIAGFIENDGGDLYLKGYSSCLWKLPAGSAKASRIRLKGPEGASMRTIEVLGGALYVLTEHGNTGSLLRMRL